MVDVIEQLTASLAPQPAAPVAAHAPGQLPPEVLNFLNNPPAGMDAASARAAIEAQYPGIVLPPPSNGVPVAAPQLVAPLPTPMPVAAPQPAAAPQPVAAPAAAGGPQLPPRKSAFTKAQRVTVIAGLAASGRSMVESHQFLLAAETWMTEMGG